MDQLKKALFATPALIAIIAAAPQAHAADKGLIWQPSKLSPQAYSLQVGMKLPTDSALRAGIEFKGDASAGGKPGDEPVRLWGSFAAEENDRPAMKTARKIDAGINARTGASTLALTDSRSWIATPTLDMELSRNYAVNYNINAGEWGSASASQSFRVRQNDTGTAVVVQAGSYDGFKTVGSSLALEQQVTDNLHVSGTVASTSTDTGISARYALSW